MNTFIEKYFEKKGKWKNYILDDYSFIQAYSEYTYNLRRKNEKEVNLLINKENTLDDT